MSATQAAPEQKLIQTSPQPDDLAKEIPSHCADILGPSVISALSPGVTVVPPPTPQLNDFLAQTVLVPLNMLSRLPVSILNFPGDMTQCNVRIKHPNP